MLDIVIQSNLPIPPSTHWAAHFQFPNRFFLVILCNNLHRRFPIQIFPIPPFWGVDCMEYNIVTYTLLYTMSV